MKKSILKAFKYLGLFLAGFIVFVLIYLLAAFTIPKIKVDAEVVNNPSIEMYILSNGVHTDMVLPVKTAHVKWNEVFPYANTNGKDTTPDYIGIGWGDKGFYLNTPTWADLTFETAFKAVFGLSTTAVHATYHFKKELVLGENCKKLMLTTEQYNRLIQYIKSSLTLNANGSSQWIETNANYGNFDAFYEANGNYSMFHTCNTWSNNALKSCGQKACIWTPFQSGIFYHYQ